jgi:hypothetical protein
VKHDHIGEDSLLPPQLEAEIHCYWQELSVASERPGKNRKMDFGLTKLERILAAVPLK